MMNPQLVSLHICTDNPSKLGTFYQQVLKEDPTWDSDEVIGFVLDGFRLEVMRHSDISGANSQPARFFFDLQVDDVRAEFVRVIGLGATSVQAPYDYADDDVQFTLATLADPDGNYFQLVTGGI